MWVTHATRNRSLMGPVGWVGTQIDGMRDLSGQMYMRNRYYDPASGRFTQEDLIGLAGGLNVYAFAGGDPISNSDPSGLSSADCCSFSQDVGSSLDPESVRRLMRATWSALREGLSRENITHAPPSS